VLETLEPFLKQAEATGKLKPAAIAEGLKTLREQIYQDFDRGVPAEQLIRGTSRSVDRVLEFCFLHFIGEQDSCNCCLVAVGGYGRSELLPGSDIDLML
jgi:[protein-PII] uridylyltransferase